MSRAFYLGFLSVCLLGWDGQIFFIYLFAYLFHLSNYIFVYLCTYVFILFILFIYLFIYLCIYQFIYLFIYLFMYSCVWKLRDSPTFLGAIVIFYFFFQENKMRFCSIS